MRYLVLAVSASVLWLASCGKQEVVESGPAPITTRDLAGAYRQMIHWEYPEFIFEGTTFHSYARQHREGNVIQAEVTRGEFRIEGEELVFSFTHGSCPETASTLRVPFRLEYNMTPAELAPHNADFSKSLVLRNNIFFSMAVPDLEAQGIRLASGCFEGGVFTERPISPLP